MRVTVIPSDRFIRRDNDQVWRLADWPFDDASIHAIQWYETKGEIERNGSPRPANEEIDNPAILEPYLAALDAYLATQSL